MVAQNYTPIDDLILKLQKSSQPVGAPKEAEPPSRYGETLQMQEAVELEPPDGVDTFVHHKQETIKLPEDLRKVGLQSVSNTQFSSYKNIKLPISDEKIVEGLNAPVSTSKRWLSEFAVYLLKQAHLALRIVGGKVVRVIKLT